jgi:hypothetical protein
MFKQIAIVVLAVTIGALCLEMGERLSVTGMAGMVSPAEARVGRPMTPRSVAGVARRTARRCAAGIYYC